MAKADREKIDIMENSELFLGWKIAFPHFFVQHKRSANYIAPFAR